MPDLFTKEQAPSYKRVDIHMLDPREITILPEFNGRRHLPPIDELLREFPDPKIGQLVNCIITKREGVPVLLAGHRRWRAALQLTEEKKGPHGDGVFKLRCSNFQGSELDCFMVTLKENMRAGTDPEEDGDNIARLIHNFSLTEEEIAVRVYTKLTLDGKPDVKWVRDRMAMAALTPEAIAALRSGQIKPNAALALAKLSAKVQRDRLKSGERITAASLKKMSTTAATAAASNTNASEPPPEQAQPERVIRTKSDFRRLIEEYIEMDIPSRITGMSCENGVRAVLGDILKDLG